MFVLIAIDDSSRIQCLHGLSVCALGRKCDGLYMPQYVISEARTRGYVSFHTHTLRMCIDWTIRRIMIYDVNCFTVLIVDLFSKQFCEMLVKNAADSFLRPTLTALLNCLATTVTLQKEAQSCTRVQLLSPRGKVTAVVAIFLPQLQ